MRIRQITQKTDFRLHGMTSILKKVLNRKTGPATATRRRVGISHLEGATAQIFHEVHRRAPHKVQTHCVHDEFHSVLLNGDIVAFDFRSEEHTSELQSLMRISYAVFCLKKKKTIDCTKTQS